MKKRKPYIALLFSILTPGLGHIYCGRPLKGLLLFGCTVVYFPLAWLIEMAGARGTSFYIAFMAVLLFSALAMLYAIGDAFFLAKRKREEMRAGPFNRSWVYILIILAGLTTSWAFPLNIKSNLVQAFRIPSSAMTPSVLIDDYLFADKALYKKRLPRYGEIVVFIYPEDRQKYFIKRVIGLPGDRIEVRGDEVIVNGHPLAHVLKTQATFNGAKGPIKGAVVEETLADRTYSILLTKSKQSNKHMGPFIVPANHCFVLGDNRNNSLDSRHFGPVPLVDVLARADFIYLPAGKWSRFGKI
ncbi:signal peptidase I [Desulfobulbus rhabdoformis]|uniref:signal peptidase I n=1 Tax=Desulfobulbus rhabdoformis TaxID=34032 RepID=UPI001965F204|nr:signal peptidase I [Desulfobulbus rhabdoformis]MBM9616933.1 signal peptidase I [Desulfobulbus rhabdoformis]